MLKHSKRYSRKKCSKGYLSRFSYKKKSGTKVKASCVKSRRSLRSRGKKATVYLPKLKSGTLRKSGYSVHNKQKSRKRSLKKAVKVYGKNVVIKKINAVRILNKNTNPKISDIYTKDLHYVQSL